MSGELKPCPHCGEDGRIWVIQGRYSLENRYGCQACDIFCNHAEGWNRRQPGPATLQILVFARAVVGPGGEAWSKDSRAMFAAFLAEHEAADVRDT